MTLFFGSYSPNEPRDNTKKYTDRRENVSPRTTTSGSESPAVARYGAVVIQSVRSERVRHLQFLAVELAGPLITFQGQVRREMPHQHIM